MGRKTMTTIDDVYVCARESCPTWAVAVLQPSLRRSGSYHHAQTYSSLQSARIEDTSRRGADLLQSRLTCDFVTSRLDLEANIELVAPSRRVGSGRVEAALGY
jgi:hypothetical protein